MAQYASTGSELSSKQVFIESFKSMKSGALVAVIGSIIYGVGLFLISMPWITAIRRPPLFKTLQEILESPLALDLLFLSLIVFTTVAVITLLGLLGWLLPGLSKLAGAHPKYSSTRSLIMVGQLVGLILLVIAHVLLLLGVRPADIYMLLRSFVMLLAGYIWFLVGVLGLAVLGFALYSTEKNLIYLVAGVIFIIGLVIPVVHFVGWTFLHIAIAESMERMLSSTR